MVQIQLITLDGCDAICTTCDAAEEMLHQVLRLCGIPIPEHDDTNQGESYLADGRTIEAVHLTCGDEAAADLDPAQAPFLRIDGETVLEGAELEPERLAERVIQALYPHGLADLRP